MKNKVLQRIFIKKNRPPAWCKYNSCFRLALNFIIKVVDPTFHANFTLSPLIPCPYRRAAAAVATSNGKGKQNGKKGAGSSDEEVGGGHKSDSSLEIIKSWKSRSRTLDPEGGR